MHRKAFKTAVRYVCGYVDTKNCEEKDKKNCHLQFSYESRNNAENK